MIYKPHTTHHEIEHLKKLGGHTDLLGQLKEGRLTLLRNYQANLANRRWDDGIDPDMVAYAVALMIVEEELKQRPAPQPNEEG